MPEFYTAQKEVVPVVLILLVVLSVLVGLVLRIVFIVPSFSTLPFCVSVLYIAFHLWSGR